MKKIKDYQGAGVYSLTDERSGKVYIGSSSQINYRINSHFSQLKKGKHYNKELQGDYNKGDSFDVKILIKLPCKIPEELTKNEKWFVDKAKEEGKELYNTLPLINNYLTKDDITRFLANMYCREHLNITLEQFFARSEAEYNMMYQLLVAPKNELEIRNYYRSAIEYQNKDRYYLNHYGISYAEFLELPKEEQEEIKAKRIKHG